MKQFSQFLHDFKAGHLDAQLTREMQELVEAVTLYQKGGKIDIQIVLKPKLEGEMAVVSKVKITAPRRDTLESIMFATPENNLVDSNPNQPALFNTPVRTMGEAPTAKIKEIK